MSQKKPIILYSMASAGMGHATRAVPIIDRMKKDYEVHIFTSRNAKKWLSKKYENLHQNLAIPGIKWKGKINITLTSIWAWLNLPRTIFYVLKIFLFIMIKRPVAVFVDFDIHASFAARLANKFYKLPIIACDNFMSIPYSEIPFKLTDDEKKLCAHWQKNIKMVTGQADYYLVHKHLETKLNHPKAQYVPIPVRDKFLNEKDNITYDGPIVISIGHLPNNDLIDALKKTPYQYIYFGHKGEYKEGNVEFKSFDDDVYLDALKKAPFSIVSGNSSAIDALALKKPVMHIPNPGMFEQIFCSKTYEYLGVGGSFSTPTSENIESFYSNLELMKANIEKLNYFDNEKVYSIIEGYIKRG